MEMTHAPHTQQPRHSRHRETVRRALGEEAAGATVIVVAQRISTVMHADEILVLDEGHVVGRGTHEELLRSCPEYLEIAQSQLSAEELGLDVQGGQSLLHADDTKGGER